MLRALTLRTSNFEVQQGGVKVDEHGFDVESSVFDVL